MMEQLVTDAFQAAARQIDDALSKGSTQVAKRRIEMLMNKLLENPSEGTIGYFAEMWKRWGYYVDVYAYLETRWNEWVTLDQRVELIRQKFHTYPAIVEFINKFECSLRELAIQSSRLGLSCRLRKLVRTVVEGCGRGQLRNELIAVIEVRFGRLINVQRYVRNLDEALWDSSRRRRMNS